MSEKTPLHFETQSFEEYKNPVERLVTTLENGLVVVMPRAHKTPDTFGEYEHKTLETLQTDQGLAFVLEALARNKQGGFPLEVNLPIAEHWLTTASVRETNGQIVFSLYWGAN